ncbi:MAG: class I SAM-dependent methyltransferase [Candidatus Thermoplasmatota archaeon]|nr:class I SAM-dependent methyltransferase [Candidatus Thermoplasmatota archaeon]
MFYGCDLLVDDKTAEEFTIYMKKFTDLYIILSKTVKHHTTASQPHILDLGCGPGLLSAELLKQIPDATVIGMDPLRKMLRLAQEHTEKSDVRIFEPVLGVSENIPLKEQSIDTIVSRFSLSYWKQPHQSFLEMNRVLRPNGKIVFETLNREFPKWKLLGIKVGMLLNHAGRDVTKYHVDAYTLAYTQEEVEMFFKKTGFLILEKQGKKRDWKFIIVAEKT